MGVSLEKSELERGVNNSISAPLPVLWQQGDSYCFGEDGKPSDLIQADGGRSAIWFLVCQSSGRKAWGITGTSLLGYLSK